MVTGDYPNLDVALLVREDETANCSVQNLLNRQARSQYRNS